APGRGGNDAVRRRGTEGNGMRLICPNCEAEYAVPDSVIPTDGRDVQCSNCGNSWFFHPSMDGKRPEPPAPVLDDTPPEPPAPAPPPAPEPTPEPDPARLAPAPRRPLEPEVAEVLREEAAFEARARARDQGLEVQEDLPLPEPDAKAAEADEAAKIAAATAISKQGAHASRRDLLPDIDEINSTLRATSDRAVPRRVTDPDAATITHRRQQGFRLGLGGVWLLLALAVLVYAQAGWIGERMPELRSELDGYVFQVDSLRAWLDGAVASLVERMNAAG
ncbi:MAG: zinc-ribbon domain-containing protein, partial [Shimia sp.]